MISSLKFEPLRHYRVVSIDGKPHVEIGFTIVGTTMIEQHQIQNLPAMNEDVLRSLSALIDMELSETLIGDKNRGVTVTSDRPSTDGH